ncbi:putative DNA-3-methyladenine glycosylase II [Helianthus annuus]|nr:putative DNA-3-methyladenine glycosylase II [Helianthus annuus]
MNTTSTMAAEDPTPKPPSPSPSPSPNTDLSQIPSKIPIRPQKIRKLSPTTTPPEHPQPQPTIADADASKSIILSTPTPNPTTPKHRRRNPSHSATQTPQIIKPLSSSGENAVVPETVLSLSPQQLKQIGVSGRKSSYLFDLANKFKNGILSDESIVKMDDRSLFTMLSMVKGIGSWSVHMFMIFSLHRPDVLPVSDLGVRKGVQVLYSLNELPRPSQMEQLCAKWRPYRSVGAWYMWRFVEGKGGQAAGGLENDGFEGQQRVGQTEQGQQQQQQQHQSQLLEPITNIGNLGACIWGQ